MPAGDGAVGPLGSMVGVGLGVKGQGMVST
jgi:hypothetical protein